MRLIFFHRFMLSHNASRKQSISTEHAVNDPFVIGQKGANFRSSIMQIPILKCKRGELHIQLSNFRPASFVFFIINNARPYMARRTLQKLTDFDTESLPHYHSPTSTFSAKTHSVSKKHEQHLKIS